MNIRLDGLHALIGGGTQGIGNATAQEMARLGAHVTLLARDEVKLKEAVAALDTSTMVSLLPTWRTPMR